MNRVSVEGQKSFKLMKICQFMFFFQRRILCDWHNMRTSKWWQVLIHFLLYFTLNAAFHCLHHFYRDNKKAERLSLNSSSAFHPTERCFWAAVCYAVVVVLKSHGERGFIRAQCEIIQLMPIFNQPHVHNRTRKKTEVMQWIPHRAQSVTFGGHCAALIYHMLHAQLFSGC